MASTDQIIAKMRAMDQDESNPVCKWALNTTLKNPHVSEPLKAREHKILDSVLGE
jgi:hypothetical protein